ncbi:MAG: glycosyltransferase [Clostridium sp.]|uniref:glycosyltransferase n=1 Tax=Clostridium sp. TaxID=1506 RepID=UPI003D6D12CF
MKLSIGMMVKNESKYLRKCLESLRPIRDAIESELIIVDTGSSDNTAEIAKEFTDKVYYHEWNSDFSEMRNITLKYSTGEWFFYIDGDEIINNPNGIIQFFNSNELKTNKTASITIKNFTSIDNEDDFTVFTAARIFEKDKDFRFEGAIHNQPMWKKPMIKLNSEFYHYGYINNDRKLMDKKFLRTSGILKTELEKNPENIYYIYQLAVSYAMHGEHQLALETIEKAYDLMKSKRIDLNKYMYVSIFLAKMYLTRGKFREVEKICLEATRKEGFYIDLYYYLGNAQCSMYKNEEAIETYNIYFKKLKDFNDFKVADNLSIINYTIGLYEYAYLDMATSYERIGKYEESLKFIKKIKSEKVLNSTHSISISSYDKLNKYDELKNFYCDIAKNHSFIASNFIDAVEVYLIKSSKKTKENIYKIFSEDDSEYSLLNNVRLSSSNLQYKLDEDIDNLNFSNLPDYFGDILYYFLCENISLVKYLQGVNDFKIKNYFNYLAISHENFEKNLYSYLNNCEITKLNLNEIRIYKIMAVYLLQDKDIDNEQYSQILEKYLEIGEKYLNQIYNENIIRNELINCMKDEEDLFLMYMHFANKNENSELIYVRYLRKALDSCNYMKRGIEILQDKVKDRAIEKNNEMEVFKKKIKESISEFIEMGNFNQANALIDEYEDIIKADPEIYSMKAVVAITENRLDDAKDILINAVNIYNDDFDLNYNLGYVYEQYQDYNKAILHYSFAEKKCGDLKAKNEISNIILNIKKIHPNVVELILKKKIVFFDKGDDKFIWDIINNLSEEFETKHIRVTDYKQIDEGMRWADICWFEWCDELVAYGSRHTLAVEKKIICRLHSYEAFSIYPSKVDWTKVNKLIFVADSIKKIVMNKFKIAESKTAIIANGVNVNEYEFQVRNSGFNIAYVGYINYKKGSMLLLHTFKAIYDKDHRYKLYIAGQFQDDRDVLYFQQMIRAFGIEKNVINEGWQNNIDKWLDDKNYILCTSVLESQNMSVMQAMAKGIKPIIHNFVGCKGIYPEKYVWNSISDAITMLSNREYNSKEYLDFVENNYGMQYALNSVKRLLMTQDDNEVNEEQFDYKGYWNKRLNDNFDIEGVGYRGLGKTYNMFLYKTRLEMLDYIIKKIFGGFKSRKVLELGPGIGIFTEYFHDITRINYCAIDISEKSQRELSRKYNEFEFILGDISEKEDYPKEKYDLIFAADVLLHLTDEEKYKNVVKNLSNVLNEEGYIIIFDPITVINSKSVSPHLVIRDIKYIENILNENNLEIIGMLPSAFFMNNPFDKDIMKGKADIVQNTFDMIQSVFGSSDIVDNIKQDLAHWISLLDKQCLITNSFGLSQKVLIIKKKINNVQIDFNINDIWNYDEINSKLTSMEKELNKNDEIKKYNLINLFKNNANKLINSRFKNI